MLVCLLVEVDMFSTFPYYGLVNRIIPKFYSKLYDSYFMKCLRKSITCYVPGVTRKEFRKPKFCFMESQQKALLKFNKIY